MANLLPLVERIRGCRLCRDAPRGLALPHEPRPVLQESATARLLIAGQAPGTRVHASGRPFTDPSGQRLRAWLEMSDAVFYDASRVAIAPMGFCFPGQDKRGADLPPRPECAIAWRAQLMAAMPQVELVLALGQHAQRWHMGILSQPRLTDTILQWRAGLQLRPRVLALPHPSWRNNGWLRNNPWFETEVLPALRAELRRLEFAKQP